MQEEQDGKGEEDAENEDDGEEESHRECRRRAGGYGELGSSRGWAADMEFGGYRKHRAEADGRGGGGGVKKRARNRQTLSLLKMLSQTRSQLIAYFIRRFGMQFRGS